MLNLFNLKKKTSAENRLYLSTDLLALISQNLSTPEKIALKKTCTFMYQRMHQLHEDTHDYAVHHSIHLSKVNIVPKTAGFIRAAHCKHTAYVVKQADNTQNVFIQQDGTINQLSSLDDRHDFKELLFSPTGKFLAVYSVFKKKHYMYLFEASPTFNMIFRGTYFKEAPAFTFHQEEKYLIIFHKNQVVVSEIGMHSPYEKYKYSLFPQMCVPPPPGKRLPLLSNRDYLFSIEGKYLYCYRIQYNNDALFLLQCVRIVDPTRAIGAACLSPNEAQLAIAYSTDNTIEILDRASSKISRTLVETAPVKQMVFLDNTTLACQGEASAHQAKQLTLWDTGTGRCIESFIGNDIIISPDKIILTTTSTTLKFFYKGTQPAEMQPSISPLVKRRGWPWGCCY